MLLNVKGIPHLIDNPIVGRVTRDTRLTGNDYLLIAENDFGAISLSNYLAVLTTLPYSLEYKIDKRAVYAVPSFKHLAEDDLVVVHPNGSISTLYRVNSLQNFLLVTERCNSNCIMCSQPPKDRDDSMYLFGIHSQLIPLIPKDCKELGITGGEPTMLGPRLFQLLELIKNELPNTEVHCLTNGRSFAWNKLVKRLEGLDFRKLMFGIPLYSDYSKSHDYIVQAKGAFNQTMRGIYNLALVGQRMELRIVLHRLTIPRLVALCRFIYKNLPFIEQVAFMGLEFQGYTVHNIKELWIDPKDYMNELSEAAGYLSSMGMNVSIYNSQLCLMPEELWKYNRKSISDWKRIYLDECAHCSIVDKCGGLFASSLKMHSQHLKAFPKLEKRGTNL